MITKRNIFGLGQTWQRSVLCLLSALAICLASCKTASQFPMDDAYYRPAPETVLPETITTPVTRNPSPVTPNPSIEYLSVQDTTITVRIKR